METSITNGIRVTVDMRFLDQHSDIARGQYLYGYHILIENLSPHTVQLLHRHWKIWDSSGTLREVSGAGVIGLQPVIESGAFHEYTSYCNLTTEWGKMKGSYLLTRLDDNSMFEVAIPEFQLIAPFKWN